MIIGIGTDIVQVSRVEQALRQSGEAFAQRILTNEEMQDYKKSKRGIAFLAKRFAIKEAISKALGTGIGRGVSFHHMNIEHDDKGKPVVVLSGGALERLTSIGGGQCLISIADEVDYATAFAVIDSVNNS